MNTQTATEYRNLPLAVLTESTTNPRRFFADVALKELADSIRVQGVLSPLLVRPITEQSFEIVAGARRYRAAQMAEAATVPVRIVNLTDAEALETALVEILRPASRCRRCIDMTKRGEPFAPTSRAANQLRDAGISADTLQGFLVRVRQPTADRHLYMVDESSLASTKQVRDFLSKLDSGDRVLLIGDTRQHQGVEPASQPTMPSSKASTAPCDVNV